MKKQAKELKEGDKLNIAGQNGIVKKIEMSDIGKQGKRKCRIEILLDNQEKKVIIRPEDYPFNCSK